MENVHEYSLKLSLRKFSKHYAQTPNKNGLWNWITLKVLTIHIMS